MPYNSVMFGPVFSEYVYSYNGLVWNRTDALVMEEGELGSYSSGSSYTFGLLEREDDVIVYCNAFEREHGRASNRPQGAKSPHSEVIVPGIIKRDRWVGLRSDRGRGEITTISLQFHSPEIFLNVHAPYGGVYAQILDSQGKPLEGFSYDDSEEIKGDYTRLAPNWRGGTPKLSSDNYYNIQVSFLEAELFAIEGDFGFTINTGVPAYDSF
ncbi:MAG: hypothetical protein GX783_08120 [Clostridiales bacterium]|nr:hypothetical protein [Clostridiales bacterium]